ncbi:zinc-regulated TonB-dependent outer membrane receptor [Myxococcota bacterium]|nr:zinc-regulated TonB-dependent outer membrane receptor [Myxococcota bacterium]
MFTLSTSALALAIAHSPWAAAPLVASTATTASATDAVDLSAIEAALAADAAETSKAPAPTGGRSLQSLLPDIAFIADIALAAFSSDENLQTGGHDPTANGFNLQQLEMAIGSKVDPYFRLDGNLVFAEAGVEIEEIYATTLELPAGLQVRFGQFLTRFGRQNATHPHSWAFADQPIALGRVFGGEGNRGLGLEVSWLAPLPWYVELLASSTNARGEATARSFYGPEDLGVDGPLDLQTTAAVKQFFPLSDDLSLALGLSGATGPNATGRSNRSDVFGVDLFVKYRPITTESTTEVALTSEWLYRRRQIPSDLLTDVSGYVQLAWRFAARWSSAARWELGTAAKGEAGDTGLDPLDPEWTASRQRTSLALTFHPTEFSRLRLQGSADQPAWRDETIWAAFLAAEVSIGAHSAHTF